ncbi:MAG TPA: hypothetical protein VIX42_05905 [Edaphobacter sp.]
MLMKNKLALMPPLLAVAALCAPAQTAPTCTALSEPNAYVSTAGNPSDSRAGQPPSIFGKEVIVPPMHVRFVDGLTGKPLTPSFITVNYGWHWLEYPYPEHAWGAWMDISDRYTCEATEAGSIKVPEHIVRPRGWYTGRYKRTPVFTDVEIVAMDQAGLAARAHIKKGEFNKLRSNDLILRITDGWQVEKIYSPPTNPTEKSS